MQFKGIKSMHELLLTFDTEDFICDRSIRCLRLILERLKKYDLNALFFISGHMAEKLANYPTIIDLLKEHEIGYHSSSHSVHPTIFEFTDTESYENAYKISLIRETSHINPLTGEIEGKGGIFALQYLFPNKEMVSYRAPGFCWSPPHTEALRDLGIKFDFSTNFSPVPVYHKGLTFYPYPTIYDWHGKLSDYRLFCKSILKRDIIVALFHPDFFVNQNHWDSIFWNEQPKQLTPPRARRIQEFKTLFRSFDLFLKQIKQIEKMNLLNIKIKLKNSEKKLDITKNCVEKIYEHSVRWPKQFFNYTPTYLRNHFFRFFESP